MTNATWRDFWLNEGTTVYFERRIMEEIYGEEIMATQAALDMVDLRETIDGMEPWESVLHIDLESRHPDDGFSSVPYDKGAAFFRRWRRSTDASVSTSSYVPGSTRTPSKV